MVVIVGYKIDTWRVTEISWRETAASIMRRFVRTDGKLTTATAEVRSLREFLSYQGTYSPRFPIEVAALWEALDLIGAFVEDLNVYADVPVHFCLYSRRSTYGSWNPG